jgi:hypothetical protein
MDVGRNWSHKALFCPLSIRRAPCARQNLPKESGGATTANGARLGTNYSPSRQATPRKNSLSLARCPFHQRSLHSASSPILACWLHRPQSALDLKEGLGESVTAKPMSSTGCGAGDAVRQPICRRPKTSSVRVHLRSRHQRGRHVPHVVHANEHMGSSRLRSCRGIVPLVRDHGIEDSGSSQTSRFCPSFLLRHSDVPTFQTFNVLLHFSQTPHAPSSNPPRFLCFNPRRARSSINLLPESHLRPGAPKLFHCSGPGAGRLIIASALPAAGAPGRIKLRRLRQMVLPPPNRIAAASRQFCLRSALHHTIIPLPFATFRLAPNRASSSI